MSQELVHIHVHRLSIPEYILFPEDLKDRSVRGSVHFREGTVQLTAAELEYLEKAPQYKHLKNTYTVVSRPGTTPPAGFDSGVTQGTLEAFSRAA
jgi:hypothetical protein